MKIKFLKAHFRELIHIFRRSFKDILPRWLKKYLKILYIYLGLYKLSYWVPRCLNFLIPESRKKGKYDLVFILTIRNWILDGICREIARYFPGRYFFQNSWEESPPPADAYFISHYAYLLLCLKKHPILWNKKILAWYTHPSDYIGVSDSEYIYAFNQVTKIICSCSQNASNLLKLGLKPEKVATILGGADPEIFLPHDRKGNGSVGFCTAYYERKNPDRILALVKLLQHRKFILLGRGWHEYKRFSELISQPNFRYFEDRYEKYQSYYEQMDVFVSPGMVEGGPIPLLEAMMCNVVPVASKTGFAPDLINHGKNGFLFEINSSAEEVCLLIEKAYLLQGDIRESVEHLTWKNLSLEVQKLLI